MFLLATKRQSRSLSVLNSSAFSAFDLIQFKLLHDKDCMALCDIKRGVDFSARRRFHIQLRLSEPFGQTAFGQNASLSLTRHDVRPASALGPGLRLRQPLPQSPKLTGQISVTKCQRLEPSKGGFVTGENPNIDISWCLAKMNCIIKNPKIIYER